MGYFKPDLPIRLGETGSFCPLCLVLKPNLTAEDVMAYKNMPRSGDVMAYKNIPGPAEVMIYTKNATLGQTKELATRAQVPNIPSEIKDGYIPMVLDIDIPNETKVLDTPNETNIGYSPTGFMRSGHAACRTPALKREMGKETGSTGGDYPRRDQG